MTNPAYAARMQAVGRESPAGMDIGGDNSGSGEEGEKRGRGKVVRSRVAERGRGVVDHIDRSAWRA